MIDDAHCGVENDLGQEVDASCVSGEEVPAINRESDYIGDKRESVQTDQDSGAVFDAVFGEPAFGMIDDAYCGVENDLGQEVDASRVSGEEATNIGDLDNTGDRGDFVQAA